MEVAKAWSRVERWLAANAPAQLPRLPSGVGEADLVAAEASMGLRLPAPLRESLVIHDGSGGGMYIYDRRRVAPLGNPMALREIVAQHRMRVRLFGDGSNDDAAEPPPGVRACWWHPSWVPALGHAVGDATCIDLTPAPDGTLGQVFGWAHDSGPGVVYAADYTAVFAGFAADLEAGRYAAKVSARGEPYLDWIE
jgi:cell wall assembly regulator SMI1